ncbi:MAG: hypothetical protein ACMV0I_06785 [Pseudomonas sp.]
MKHRTQALLLMHHLPRQLMPSLCMGCRGRRLNGLRATIETLTTALSSAILRIQTLETNMANAVVYSDGKLHY